MRLRGRAIFGDWFYATRHCHNLSQAKNFLSQVLFVIRDSGKKLFDCHRRCAQSNGVLTIPSVHRLAHRAIVQKEIIARLVHPNRLGIGSGSGRPRHPFAIAGPKAVAVAPHKGWTPRHKFLIHQLCIQHIAKDSCPAFTEQGLDLIAVRATNEPVGGDLPTPHQALTLLADKHGPALWRDPHRDRWWQ